MQKDPNLLKIFSEETAKLIGKQSFWAFLSRRWQITIRNVTEKIFYSFMYWTKCRSSEVFSYDPIFQFQINSIGYVNTPMYILYIILTDFFFIVSEKPSKLTMGVCVVIVVST